MPCKAVIEHCSDPYDSETPMTAGNDIAVRRALQAAGVEIIDENGGGPV